MANRASFREIKESPGSSFKEINKKKVRLVLFGTYGEQNTGDDYMLASQLREFKRRFPYGLITVLSGNLSYDRNVLEREKLTDTRIRLLYSGRMGLREPGKKRLSALKWFLENIKEIFRADILLIGPGNQIQDVTRPFRLLFFLSRAALSWLARTPFAFFGIGFYQVEGFLCRFLLRFFCKRAAFISTRDNQSALEFRKLVPRCPPVFGLSDVTFLHPWPMNTIKPAKAPSPIIGLTYRIFLPEVFPSEVSENLEHSLATLLKHIHEQMGAEFYFFPFYKNPPYQDTRACDNLLKRIGKQSFPLNIVSFNTLSELRDKMILCDAFIGVRYHSVLISVQNSIPVLGISYAHKTWRFMNDFNLQDFGTQVQDVTEEKIIKIWDLVWKNRSDLKKRYQEVRKLARRRAKIHFDLVEDVTSLS